MNKEEIKQKLIEILTKNLVNGYDAMNEHIPVINVSQIPFIADDIAGLHLFHVICCAKFKNIKAKYIDSTGLFIGKLKIVEYYYDGSRPRGDIKKYRVTSPINTIKSDLGHYETEQECIDVCLKVYDIFIKQISHSI